MPVVFLLLLGFMPRAGTTLPAIGSPPMEENVMSHSSDNRQIRTPGPNDRCVVQQCRKFGIGPAEERKLLRLLGKHAPQHEVKNNEPPRPPRFR